SALVHEHAVPRLVERSEPACPYSIRQRGHRTDREVRLEPAIEDDQPCGQSAFALEREVDPNRADLGHPAVGLYIPFRRAREELRDPGQTGYPPDRERANLTTARAPPAALRPPDGPRRAGGGHPRRTSGGACRCRG